MTLAAADWIFIVWYFILSIGIGLYYSKRAGKSTSEYFLSGRSLPWWLLGTSMVATTFSSDTPLGSPGSSSRTASPATGSGGTSCSAGR